MHSLRCLSEAASDRRLEKSSFCKISALKYKVLKSVTEFLDSL